MPLQKGSGRDVISANIAEMMKSGRPPKQAIAASLSQARKAGGQQPPRPLLPMNKTSKAQQAGY